MAMLAQMQAAYVLLQNIVSAPGPAPCPPECVLDRPVIVAAGSRVNVVLRGLAIASTLARDVVEHGSRGSVLMQETTNAAIDGSHAYVVSFKADAC